MHIIPTRRIAAFALAITAATSFLAAATPLAASAAGNHSSSTAPTLADARASLAAPTTRIPPRAPTLLDTLDGLDVRVDRCSQLTYTVSGSAYERAQVAAAVNEFAGLTGTQWRYTRSWSDANVRVQWMDSIAPGIAGQGKVNPVTWLTGNVFVFDESSRTFINMSRQYQSYWTDGVLRHELLHAVLHADHRWGDTVMTPRRYGYRETYSADDRRFVASSDICVGRSSQRTATIAR